LKGVSKNARSALSLAMFAPK